MQVSQSEPELDWVDLAILDAWHRLCDDMCSQCGRPLPLHEEQSPADFHVGARTCPATLALDEAQARQALEDQEASERAEKRGDKLRARLNPDRARTWLTWTDDEGEPPY